MVQVLRPAKFFKEGHRVRVPSGDVAGQLFQHGERALATAVIDSVSDIRTAAHDVAVDGVVGDEAADVGYDPIGAGFDEQIVP